jgi:hypothetical protein
MRLPVFCLEENTKAFGFMKEVSLQLSMQARALSGERFICEE